MVCIARGWPNSHCDASIWPDRQGLSGSASLAVSMRSFFRVLGLNRSGIPVYKGSQIDLGWVFLGRVLAESLTRHGNCPVSNTQCSEVMSSLTYPPLAEAVWGTTGFFLHGQMPLGRAPGCSISAWGGLGAGGSPWGARNWAVVVLRGMFFLG